MDRRIAVGLGNPGPEYRETRHNLGFMVVERVASDHGLSFVEGPGPFRRATLDEARSLVEPWTYMNRSGLALAWLQAQGELGPDEILVIIDDLALPPGTLRLRVKGSHGGHNGLRSIEAELGTQAYARLRLGIGDGRDDTVDHVLGRPQEDELEILEVVVDAASSLVKDWFEGASFVDLMSRYNRRLIEDPPEDSEGPPNEPRPSEPRPNKPRPDADGDQGPKGLQSGDP